MRETIASVGDLGTKARQHHLDELKALAAGIEVSERETQATLGIDPDNFTPSATLAGLREQHRRSREWPGHTPTRAELTPILANL